MDVQTSERLIKACRLGDTDDLHSILMKFPQSINQPDTSLGWTPLYRTVTCENEPATKYLLEHQANPNLKTRTGQSPLHQTADQSHTRLAQLLLDFKADPNQTQNDGDTPLHYAAIKGNTALISLLISKGADPDIRNSVFLKTPLHYAVQNSEFQSVKTLVKNGASLAIKDINDKSPIQISKNNEMNRLLTGEFSPRTSPLNLLMNDPIDIIPNIPTESFVTLNLSPQSQTNSESSPQSKFPLSFNTSQAKKVQENPNKSISTIFEPDAQTTSIISHKHPPDFTFGVRQKYPVLYHWLISYRLEDVFQALLEGGYDDLQQMSVQMNSSIPITQEILRSIGISKSGHRRRLLAALDQQCKPSKSPRKQVKTENNPLKCCVLPSHSTSEFTNIPTFNRWLDQLNLGHLHSLFIENGYEELEYLLALMHTPWEINDEVLQEIGVDKPGYRHRLLARLKEDCHAVDTMKRSAGGMSTRRRREELANERKANQSNSRCKVILYFKESFQQMNSVFFLPVSKPTMKFCLASGLQNLLAVATGSVLNVYDSLTLKLECQLKMQNPIKKVYWSFLRLQIAVVQSKGRLDIWDLEDGKVRNFQFDEEISALAWDLQKNVIAVSAGTVKVIEQEGVRDIERDLIARVLRWNKYDKLMVVSDKTFVCRGDEVQEIKIHGKDIY